VSRAVLAVLVAAGVALAMGAVWPDHSAEQEATRYCQMVHDGAWPDYDRVYTAQCRADGTVNEEYAHGR
jgi:hypothetical protein